MTSARLAWAMFGISAVSNTAGLVLVALLPAASLEGEGDQSLLLSAAFTLTTLVFALVGAIVSSRLPANPIGWLFCGAGVVLGMESATYGYAAYALVAHPGLPGASSPPGCHRGCGSPHFSAYLRCSSCSSQMDARPAGAGGS